MDLADVISNGLVWMVLAPVTEALPEGLCRQTGNLLGSAEARQEVYFYPFNGLPQLRWLLEDCGEQIFGWQTLSPEGVHVPQGGIVEFLGLKCDQA